MRKKIENIHIGKYYKNVIDYSKNYYDVLYVKIKEAYNYEEVPDKVVYVFDSITINMRKCNMSTKLYISDTAPISFDNKWKNITEEEYLDIYNSYLEYCNKLPDEIKNVIN